MAALNGYTPTEKLILKVFRDGHGHTVADIKEKIGGDEYMEDLTVRVHICNIRKKLKARSEDIVCVLGYQNKKTYLHIKRLPARD